MAIYLVRHAKAGDRDDWDGDDRLRPLSKSGREQAKALADLLAPYPIRRILSSPSLRCVQTVEPLAQRLRIRIEETQALAEGAGTAPLRRLMGSLAATEAALCSHGDVIQELVDELVGDGVIPGSQAGQLAKGSTWVLDERNGMVVAARYLAAP